MMWQARCIGLKEAEYQFLINLKPDALIKIEVKSDQGIYVEHYLPMDCDISLEAGKVMDLAKNNLAIYQSFLAYNGLSSEIKIDTVVKDNPDGTKHSYMFFCDTLKISADVSCSINGVPVLPDKKFQDDKNRLMLDNVISCASKRDLLQLLTQDVNWANAYKVYEILKDKHSDEKVLKAMPQLKYFSHTANSPNAIGVVNARHAVQGERHNPKKISNLNESWLTLKAIANEYLLSK